VFVRSDQVPAAAPGQEADSPRFLSCGEQKRCPVVNVQGPAHLNAPPTLKIHFEVYDPQREVNRLPAKRPDHFRRNYARRGPESPKKLPLAAHASRPRSERASLRTHTTCPNRRRTNLSGRDGFRCRRPDLRARTKAVMGTDIEATFKAFAPTRTKRFAVASGRILIARAR